MYSIISKLLNAGHDPSQPQLVNLGRQMYNFDLLLGMVMPYIAWVLYFFFGTIPHGFFPLIFIIPTYYGLNYFAVQQGYFLKSVFITFVLNFVLLLVGGFFMEPVLVPLIGVGLAINGFIILPGRKLVARIYFIFFFTASLVLAAIDLFYKLEHLRDFSRLPALMATPLIIFGMILLI
ncbi:MAG: hypothetical protein AAFV80_03725, partial [Bacteroidota bacterium]